MWRTFPAPFLIDSKLLVMLLSGARTSRPVRSLKQEAGIEIAPAQVVHVPHRNALAFMRARVRTFTQETSGTEIKEQGVLRRGAPAPHVHNPMCKHICR